MRFWYYRPVPAISATRADKCRRHTTCHSDTNVQGVSSASRLPVLQCWSGHFYLLWKWNPDLARLFLHLSIVRVSVIHLHWTWNLRPVLKMEGIYMQGRSLSYPEIVFENCVSAVLIYLYTDTVRGPNHFARQSWPPGWTLGNKGSKIKWHLDNPAVCLRHKVRSLNKKKQSQIPVFKSQLWKLGTFILR